MNKSRLVNCLGILFSVGIALGGLFLVWNMLKESKEAMLSQSGEAEVANLFPQVSVSRQEKKVLTKSELFHAVKSMESDKEEYPHEPVEGQLSMEQAIERGKEWVEELCSRYLGAEVLIPEKYNKITASLCIKEEEGGMGEDSYLYSYWRITLTGEYMEAKLLLNAVTGLAFDTAISSKLPEISFEQAKAEEFLAAYVEDFGFEGEEVTDRKDSVVSMRLGQENLYAAAQIAGIMVGRTDMDENEYDSTTIFHLYLTTGKLFGIYNYNTGEAQVFDISLL